MKKRTLWLVGLTVISWLFFWPSSGAASESVRLAYISDSPGSSAPYWIAKEAGFYKKYGLDVELISTKKKPPEPSTNSKCSFTPG